MKFRCFLLSCNTIYVFVSMIIYSEGQFRQIWPTFFSLAPNNVNLFLLQLFLSFSYVHGIDTFDSKLTQNSVQKIENNSLNSNEHLQNPNASHSLIYHTGVYDSNWAVPRLRCVFADNWLLTNFQLQVQCVLLVVGVTFSLPVALNARATPKRNLSAVLKSFSPFFDLLFLFRLSDGFSC